MLMQKNANINVMAHEELKTDIAAENRVTSKAQQKNYVYMPELKWGPSKKFKEGRVVVPFFQVCFFRKFT